MPAMENRFSSRMPGDLVIVLALYYLLLLFLPLLVSSVPVSRTSVEVAEQLSRLCGYNGISYCNPAAEEDLREQYKAMAISDDACAVIIRSILCARCGLLSDKLFKRPNGQSTTKKQNVPSLSCSNKSGGNYCKLVWETCKDADVTMDSHFKADPSREGASNSTVDQQSSKSQPRQSTKYKLADFWRSEADFCSSFGTDKSPCFDFDGRGVNLRQQAQHRSRSLQGLRPPPQAICLEKIGAGSYLTMVAHPDGSGKVFLSSQEGRIWSASVPKHGSGGTLQGFVHGEEANLFLDITDRVYHGAGGLGLTGVAFHPGFITNGRFFVSYTCDSLRSPTCGVGRCDISKFGAASRGAGSPQPCRYQLVVAEFSAKGRGFSEAMTTADPKEVRRIFAVSLPQMSEGNHGHGGQILLSPRDGYLYLISGHAGRQGRGAAEHTDLSEDKTSFLGKIVRLDIDNLSHVQASGEPSSAGEATTHIPNNKLGMVLAMAVGDPRGCSFYFKRPYEYLYCTNVHQEQYEEVHLINTEGGNYSTSSIIPMATVRLPAGTWPSITGGLIYGGSRDPSLERRYLYMYGSDVWAATEIQDTKSSGRFVSAQIPMSGCSASSPLACSSGDRSVIAGSVISFAEDNNKDAFLLATGGVYRVVLPSLCGYSGGGAHRSSEKLASSTAADGAQLSQAMSQLSTVSPSWVGVVLSIVSFYAFMWWYLKQFCAANGGDREPTGMTGNYSFGCCNNMMCCAPTNNNVMTQYISRRGHREIYRDTSRVSARGHHDTMIPLVPQIEMVST